MDQNFFGSEVVETAVLPPADMVKEEDADLKYETIPIYDEENLQGKAASLVDDNSDNDDNDDNNNDDGDSGEEDQGQDGEEEGSTQKSELPKETDRKQENPDQPKSLTVNYGYHPIIDFFDRYRFDAAA